MLVELERANYPFCIIEIEHSGLTKEKKIIMMHLSSTLKTYLRVFVSMTGFCKNMINFI